MTITYTTYETLPILPLLPLRDIVVLPYSTQALFIGRPRSLAALQAASKHPQEQWRNHIIVSAQKGSHIQDPQGQHLYRVGTLATIQSCVAVKPGTMRAVIQGLQRITFDELVPAADSGFPLDDQTDALYTHASFLNDIENSYETISINSEDYFILSRVEKLFIEWIRTQKKTIPPHVQSILEKTSWVEKIQALIAYTPIEAPEKQIFLEERNPVLRTEQALRLIVRVLEQTRQQQQHHHVKKNNSALSTTSISSNSEAPVSHTPALKSESKSKLRNAEADALQEELKQEFEALEKRIAEKTLSADAKLRLEKEFRKLKWMNQLSAEASVVRNYIDVALSLPWNAPRNVSLSIPQAQQQLENDHDGLEKVKERILDFLGIQLLAGTTRGPILCFVGPPGVGKTSLAQSIAKATGREFVRVSLGGVRDEADIRGHRRTYIGAFPGKIISAFKRCSSSNPVILLDEIDKMTSDYRGDPAAAMLEVLDPEQNHRFLDHYLDLEYDLSNVLFIATANSTSSMPAALLDRLEIITLSGYTDDEKMHIAKRHLWPKQLIQHGLLFQESHQELSPRIVLPSTVLKHLIRHYTKESGVRSLERELGTLCRKTALELMKKTSPIVIETSPTTESSATTTTNVLTPWQTAIQQRRFRLTTQNLRTWLGAPKYRREKTESNDFIGVVNGLAYNQTGGDVLLIEVLMTPGKGKITITGNMGSVMNESAQAAWTVIRSKAPLWGLSIDFAESLDVHIHVPEGATPKDGPSAGITMTTALMSALMQIPIRHDVAMTGEMTLRGRVLPIGGLKEKCLAAIRDHITAVCIPLANKPQWEELPHEIHRLLRVYFVETIDDVWKHALHPNDLYKLNLKNVSELSKTSISQDHQSEADLH